jgi:hypothetical protein
MAPVLVGDRSHGSKVKVAHADKYCQVVFRVITLSLSNSFANISGKF